MCRRTLHSLRCVIALCHCEPVTDVTGAAIRIPSHGMGLLYRVSLRPARSGCAGHPHEEYRVPAIFLAFIDKFTEFPVAF